LVLQFVFAWGLRIFLRHLQLENKISSETVLSLQLILDHLLVAPKRGTILHE